MSIASYTAGCRGMFITLSLLCASANAAAQPGLKTPPDSIAYILGEVTVQANRDHGIHTPDTLKAKDIQNIPSLFSNILSSVKILPGVTSNSELSSTYNVRGGNFDENLLYLNGYEIFQPHLLQQGIEQSQSMLNENLISSMEFHHGAFPVQFGDKMSSVLAVNYSAEESARLGGVINADLFNMGVTLHDRTGNLNWRMGFRYAYPTLFDKTLQTAGQYKPRFDDFQFLGTYDLPNRSAVQLFVVTSRNNFGMTPESWFGNFQTSYLAVRQVTLDFTGYSKYTYATDLFGLKYMTPVTDHSTLTTSLAYCSDKKKKKKSLSYDVHYSADAYSPLDGRKYLESGYEYVNNSLATERLDFLSEYSAVYNGHTITAGAGLRYSTFAGSLDEAASYRGADSVMNTAKYANQQLTADFHSISAYISDNVYVSDDLIVNAGVRALKYYFNGELLVSPRAGVSYKHSEKHSMSFSWGYYYQPPYFYETWNKRAEAATSLSAQKDIHYNLSWEYQFKERARCTAEVYYKDLSRLIPYYVDQLQLTYGDRNNFEGFAYGLDLQYEGEVVPGMETWIGYSYLNAKEREAGGNFSYESRPLDQTHTIRIFLQDNVKSHPDFQTHVLFLFGTGYHYYAMKSVPGAAPGSYVIVPNYNATDEYPFYFRVDMGLTYRMKFNHTTRITLTAEVLNVFNKNNVTSYSWFHVFEGTTQPVPVANVLSPRYFNAGFKLEF